MHRSTLGLVLCFALLLAAPGPALAADAAVTPAAETPIVDAPAVEAPAAEVPVEAPPEAEAPMVRIDGTAAGLDFTMYGGTAYVSLPLAAAALRPDAAYAWEDDRVVVRGEGLVLSARQGNCYLEVNGRYLYIPDGVKALDNGDTLVPARTLARALGAQITWDGAVNFTSGGAALESGDTFYDPQAVDLLARVIFHESGYQPFLGQLAVGNVILNRVKSPAFPNTIYDVIYESNQFPGATSKEPSAAAVIAAKLCLDGAVVLDNAYYFNGAGKDCWAARNKTLVATIGGHAFYG